MFKKDAKNTSVSKQKRKKLEFIMRKEERFPSFGWFMGQKPKETKVRDDHCTGLCKDCEGPQINYEALRIFKKKMCKCKTKECPSWFCMCEQDDFGETTPGCDCDVCSCDNCLKCEVRYDVLNFDNKLMLN